MNDVVNLILTMALGACMSQLIQMWFADMGGMPKMPRRGDENQKTKLEIAENTISEGSVELQESYIESLSFWQLSSSFIEKELAKTKAVIEKFREVKSA